MNSVCIVSFCNFYLLPYADYYIKSVLDKGLDCYLLYWDRDDNTTTNENYKGCHEIIYRKYIDQESSAREKELGYVGAMLFFYKALLTNHFDKIIFLQSHAAVACLPLIPKYKNRYLVDIRDYSFENFSSYRSLESIVTKNSFDNIISSKAYMTFLPKGHYVIAHNYSPVSFHNNSFNATEPIRISFIGSIRFIDINKKLLQLFSNNDKFQLNYYGRGSEVLRNYCENESIKNVDFYGSFNPNQTIDFYKRTDLINNIYGNNSNYLDFALSNKLYYACQCYIPILVCKNTYMSEVVEDYNLGFVFDIDNPNEPNRLYDWYNHFDWNDFIEGCNSFLSIVEKENEDYHKVVDVFLD